MRIWTYKTADEKAHTFLRRSKNVKKRTKTDEKRILCKFNLEELLFCKTLQLHTRDKDIFKIIDGFFNDISISWDKCVGICNDGAAPCTGTNSGVVKRVKEKGPKVKKDPWFSSQTSTHSKRFI